MRRNEPRHRVVSHRLATLAVVALLAASCGGSASLPVTGAQSSALASAASATAPTVTPARPAPTAAPGTTQSVSPAPASDSTYATSVAFWNVADGLAGLTIDHPDGSTSGELLSTKDGGTTWSSASPSPSGIIEVAVAGSADAWAVAGCPGGQASCEPRLYRTTDAGVTWTSTTMDLGWVSFADPLHGWGVTGSGLTADPNTVAFRRTTDGGSTWTTMPAPCAGLTVGPLRAVAFRSTTSGLAVCALTAGAGGELHAVLETKDGGRHWVVRSSTGGPPDFPATGSIPYGGYITGIVVAADGTAWISGQRMVPLASTDGGATWRPLALGDPAANLVVSAFPLDARRGFALMWAPDRQATLFEGTTDGGRTWTERSGWSVATGQGIGSAGIERASVDGMSVLVPPSWLQVTPRVWAIPTGPRLFLSNHCRDLPLVAC